MKLLKYLIIIIKWLSLIILSLFYFKIEAFEIKMSDAISPFFSQNSEIKHYSWIPFYQLDLYNQEELVDEAKLNNIKTNFINYIKLLKENSYNSISLDDLNHLISFQKSWIYKNTNIEKRNNIYLKFYKELVEIAKANEISVYITTDMQFYSNLLEKKIWDIDLKNKELIKYNKEAFEEIFTNIDWISGIIIRIWEGWKAYNSWDYKSSIIYTSPEDVNILLKELEPIFKKYNKKIIFRTWTIWIWKIWNLITNKETYDETFKWLDNNIIIISIKHTPWDFFWFEKLNPLIWYWNFKQIVEIQIRREYEWWWDFPNYIWDYYRWIIKEIQNKKNVIWVWNWNQTWWWWWWKNILFNYWFDFWNQINFFSVGQILKDENENLDIILAKYDFNDIEKELLKNILKNSREIIKKWWYINDFREKSFNFKWVYMPPLSRIWWDKTTSSPVILSFIYNSLDKKYQTIEESAYILAIQKEEINKWWKLSRKNELNIKIYNSLINRYKIFEINHLFKKSFIYYFQTWKKEHYYEIDTKIKEYNEFKKDKEYINFDFEEIYKFYNKIDYKIIYFYLNIISFIVFLIYLFLYRKINIFYNKNRTYKYLLLAIILVDISILTISPIFFISEYNFYWFIIKINYIFMFFILLYFFILNKILNLIYKINIKLKSNIWKIIHSLSPILISLEIIIIISYILWEQFFWYYLTLWVFNDSIRIVYFIVFLMYISIFLYYWFIFSNIYNFYNKVRYKKTTNLLSFIFLIAYFFIILNINFTDILANGIIKNIIPSYFNTAWSDVKSFF